MGSNMGPLEGETVKEPPDGASFTFVVIISTPVPPAAVVALNLNVYVFPGIRTFGRITRVDAELVHAK